MQNALNMLVNGCIDRWMDRWVVGYMGESEWVPGQKVLKNVFAILNVSRSYLLFGERIKPNAKINGAEFDLETPPKKY